MDTGHLKGDSKWSSGGFPGKVKRGFDENKGGNKYRELILRQKNPLSKERKKNNYRPIQTQPTIMVGP